MQKYVDFLFKNPKGAKLTLISQILAQVIPFNSPHGFRFLEISDQKIKIRLPFIRKNKNHLGGIHACAIATLGEYCAGILLLKNLGTKEYRYILSDLKIKYHYQGRMDLIGEAIIEEEKIQLLRTSLESQDKTTQEVLTEIRDVKNNHVATVFSTWQLKKWDKVHTK